MDELSRTQKIIEKFFESDKPLELGMLALNLIITILIGLIVIKLILSFTRRALKRRQVSMLCFTRS